MTPNMETVYAGGPTNKSAIIEGGTPVGYQQLSVAGTATGLTVPENANTATIVVEDASVRFRSDGTSPTATVGVSLWQNQSFQIQSREILTAIEFISQSGTAELNIEYYERK